ncbi:MAG TPA: hypothetical protein VIF62_38385, partial [Labilithrix sp.]
KRWFRENGIAFLRSYPSSLVSEERLSGGELFAAAEDDWGLEALLAQVAWTRALWAEGGLFVAVGQRMHEG